MSVSGPESVTSKFINWTDNMDGQHFEMVVDVVDFVGVIMLITALTVWPQGCLCCCQHY